MKCRFVDAEKAVFPVQRLCKTIELSPKTYYAWRRRDKSARQLAAEQLLVLIRAAFDGQLPESDVSVLQACFGISGTDCARRRRVRCWS